MRHHHLVTLILLCLCGPVHAADVQGTLNEPSGVAECGSYFAIASEAISAEKPGDGSTRISIRGSALWNDAADAKHEMLRPAERRAGAIGRRVFQQARIDKPLCERDERRLGL